MKRYKATGTVIIAKTVTVFFDDDGKTELLDQANDAVRDSDDIPLSMHHDIDSVDDLEWSPVGEGE